MSKINIKSTLNNLTEEEMFNVETVGIFLDNRIKYIDNSVEVILELKNDTIFLERTGIDYRICMEFDKNNITSGIYEINNLGKFDLKVEVLEMNIKEKEIYIKYNMYINDNKQDFEYKIMYEER